MYKRNLLLFDLLILLIITIPTFTSILNNQYFTIHDNQHVVRLHLLDQGIRQGYLYPRWVDKLSFGFGDPLFNFYPPLVYYLAEIFHLIGFSLIWSIKLVFILGFLTAAFSMYLLAKEYLGRWPGILASTIYTYLFYHGVNAYVRGALADFFAISFLPLVFLSFYKLFKNINYKNSLFFGLSLALVILTHQLIALPLVFFLFFYFLFYYFKSVEKTKLIRYLNIGLLFGFGIAAFYWLPMFIEKSLTFLDIELGGYKLHYIYPYQFWYSPWGFGASVPGIQDGMTFQLGKIPIALFGVSIFLFFIYLFKVKDKKETKNFIFFIFLLFFSFFMMTEYSSFLWDRIKLLWSLQFPWRFYAFASIFISILSSWWVVFIEKISKNKLPIFILPISVGLVTFILILKYQSYFRPQAFLNVKDKDLTTEDQIVWEQSKTVLHFVPKGVKAKKNEYGVYVLNIEKKDLPKSIYQINSGKAEVKILQDKFQEKKFEVESKTTTKFQLNTFNFAGWAAYLNNKKITIDDDNPYKLITVSFPKGNYQLKFVFNDTISRKIGNGVSIVSIFIIFIFLSKGLFK